VTLVDERPNEFHNTSVLTSSRKGAEHR